MFSEISDTLLYPEDGSSRFFREVSEFLYTVFTLLTACIILTRSYKYRTHIKRSRATYKIRINNFYMFRRLSAIFRESKVQRRTNRSTTIHSFIHSFIHSLIIKKSINGTEPMHIELVTYLVPKYTYRTTHNIKLIFIYFKQ